MNPYKNLPRQSFWRSTVQSSNALEADFDCGRKFTFSGSDVFATAGSCFAQHFARRLAEKGGQVLVAEKRHPLVGEESGHGYGVFSARYGNLYTVRQLLELLEQAYGMRPVVHEYARRRNGRFVDMLRPRAVPMGFASEAHARADRFFHLSAVREMIRRMSVFVFTLGLTEAWVNEGGGYCYPVVPGSVAGVFHADLHRFRNFSFGETIDELRKVVALVREHNPVARMLLTVSPVGLVATAEPRNVIVSTAASKSILRAAVDEVVRSHEHVDYFPSYEIITSPYSRGGFWAEGLRDVTEQAVETVMEIFFRSRMPGLEPPRAVGPATAAAPALERAITRECDEMFLDPSLRGCR